MSDAPIIDFATCWSCRFGEHRYPPTPHTWGDADDFAWAERAQMDPPGVCGCECATPHPRLRVHAEEHMFPEFIGAGRFWIWRWVCRECAYGSEANGARALAAALAHRWSPECVHNTALAKETADA